MLGQVLQLLSSPALLLTSPMRLLLDTVSYYIDWLARYSCYIPTFNTKRVFCLFCFVFFGSVRIRDKNYLSVPHRLLWNRYWTKFTQPFRVICDFFLPFYTWTQIKASFIIILGDNFCWISNGKALLVVLGVPVALILMFNCAAITITLLSIWKVQKVLYQPRKQKISPESTGLMSSSLNVILVNSDLLLYPYSKQGFNLGICAHLKTDEILKFVSIQQPIPVT